MASGSCGPSFDSVCTDEVRALELYKYFQPPANDGESPDPILTAHAQLVAWRLNAERSMITLIDEHVQYFVAESTKTLHLDDAQKHEEPNDAIWAGCVRVSKAGRLCEHTIAASRPEVGGPACFEVLDLAKDTRFNSLDFVAGPPYFRNYAGVPLRTRKGINIGSIFVIDSRVRPALTVGERHFLGVVADNVVQHLEMLKDRKDCQRALTMSACISTYVNPLCRPALHEPKSEVNDRVSRFSPSIKPRNHIDDHGRSNLERLNIFRRASELLLEGLDYDDSGGEVLFLDTLEYGSELDHCYNDSAESSSSQASDGDVEMPVYRPTATDSRPPARDSVLQDDVDRSRSSDVLAHTIQPAKVASVSDSKAVRACRLSPKDLSRIIKRFPEGKLLTFDSQGHILNSSSDEFPEQNDPFTSPRRHTKKNSKKEADILRCVFPTARQIIFLPVWDPSTARWTVCIAHHASKFRIQSYKSEFVFCATFGNIIIAELTKLATMQANQQKNDFMASISHELRSPLHGIMASCEFLDDTDPTPFQQSLIGTADSCARTLLDTINMVLDYSTINRSEQAEIRENKDMSDVSASKRAQSLQGSLSTQRTIDVASLVEEVVDGLAAGHIFENHSKRKASISASHLKNATPDSPLSSGVKLILDIESHNWTYLTEPGALRRIVLNLVENAVKFTEQGFVHISLACKDRKPSAAGQYVVLTVTDSGQGISPMYLHNKLFSPFSQESHLTPGTGLGLSLVKSIVRSIGGKISIKSSVGQGTTATVKLPMTRKPSTTQDRKNSVGPVHFDNAAEWNRSTTISTLRSRALGRTAAIFRHELPDGTSTENRALTLLQASLSTYLSEWFGFSISPWQKGGTYDMVITTCDGLKNLEQSSSDLFAARSRTTVLAIGDVVATSFLDAHAKSGNAVVLLPSPFGPSRLAQVLGRCMDRPLAKKEALQKYSCQDNVIESMSVRLENVSIESSHTSSSGEHAGEVEDPQSINCTVSDVPFGRETDSKCGSLITVDVTSIESPGAIVIDTAPSLETSGSLSNGIDTDNGTAPSAVTLSINPTNELDTSISEPTIIRTSSPQIQPPQPTHVTKPTDCRPHILLVDDNNINLRLLQVYSKKLGYTHAHSAENGQVAVDTYKRLLSGTPSTPPRIILMDISMPIMDGFEATRRIRKAEAEHNSSLASGEIAQRSLIIALTGLSSLRDQREAFAAGVDRYLMKPISFAKLSLLLEEWYASETSAAVVSGADTPPI